MLIAAGSVEAEATAGRLFVGELSCAGTLRHTQGIVPMVLGAREQNLRDVFVPAVNAAEAALVSDGAVIGVSSLVQLVQHLAGAALIPVTERDGTHPEPISYGAPLPPIGGVAQSPH